MKFIAYRLKALGGRPGALLCRPWSQAEQDAVEFVPPKPELHMGRNVVFEGPAIFDASTLGDAWIHAESVFCST